MKLTKDEKTKLYEQIRLLRNANPEMTKTKLLEQAVNNAGLIGLINPRIQSCGHHYNKAMGIVPTKCVTNAPVFQSAYDRLQDARKTILQCIKDLEFENEQLHKKILEHDDVIARYKKLI